MVLSKVRNFLKMVLRLINADIITYRNSEFGEDAGQTIMHCHTHLIPRRHSDVAEPRGGVRGVIPDKQNY